MADLNQNIDQAKDMLNLEQKDFKKLPQALNVLTILTYIGCALGLISALYNYFTVQASYKVYEGLSGTLNELTKETGGSAVASMTNAAGEVLRKSAENRLWILLAGLVGIALCFYGAMQMRNLKKQGYMMYVIGELLPILCYIVFVGVGSIFGGIAMIAGTLVAAVFIILYTMQRKHLVN